MNSPNQKQTFPTGLELKIETAIAGLLSHLPAGTTQLTVGGVTYQVADLVKHAEELVQPWRDIRGARSVVRQVIAARPVDEPKLRTFAEDLKYSLSTLLGRESEELRHFGFTPVRRRRKLTAEEQVAKAEKANETREAHKPAPRSSAPSSTNPTTGPNATGHTA